MTTTGGSFAKVILCIWNIAFVGVAVCLILVGSRKFLVPDHEDNYVLGFTWETVSTTFIILGVIVATASLTGFAGAACESTFLLKSYVYFIITGLVAIFGLIIANWLYGDLVLNGLDDYFSQLMVNSTSVHGDIAAANAINTWQKVALCCGQKGPSDWNNLTIIEKHHSNKSSNGSISSISSNINNYPMSCCGEIYLAEAKSNSSSNTSFGPVCNETNLLYHEGCFSVPLIEWYKMMTVIGTSTFLGLLVLLLSLTCCLERERKLADAKLINAQYVAHLKSCIGSGRAIKGSSSKQARGVGKPIRGYNPPDISSF